MKAHSKMKNVYYRGIGWFHEACHVNKNSSSTQCSSRLRKTRHVAMIAEDLNSGVRLQSCVHVYSFFRATGLSKCRYHQIMYLIKLILYNWAPHGGQAAWGEPAQ
jgi:hypothetical protein